MFLCVNGLTHFNEAVKKYYKEKMKAKDNIQVFIKNKNNCYRFYRLMANNTIQKCYLF